MQIEWIRAFVLLREKMSFSEAADEMFLSQSGFSKYIKALENELGVTLVDRSRHRLRFTPQGEAVWEAAQNLLADYEKMLEAAREASCPAGRTIRLAVEPSAEAVEYLSYVLAFFENNRQYELSLSELDTSGAMKAFEAGDMDMVIGHGSQIGRGSEYDELILKEEELFFTGSTRFIPAQWTETDLQTAFSGRMIVHQNMYEEIRRILHRAGINENTLRPVVTTTSMDVLKAYVRGGMSATLLSSAGLAMIDPEGELRRIHLRESPRLTLGLIYDGARLSAAGSGLLTYLRKKTAGA